jgi:hypothetical protein
MYERDLHVHQTRRHNLKVLLAGNRYLQYHCLFDSWIIQDE